MRRPGTVTRSFSAAALNRPVLQRAPAAASVATANRPTAEYQRHHSVSAPLVDATAFRQGWRVATRLDALLEAGRIDDETWRAALEWRRWAEVITPVRVQCWEVRVDQSPATAADSAALHRVNAAMRLRQVGEALGELRVRLLEACVVRDRPWHEIAALIRVTDKTATRWVVEALTALADWRAGRAVAPPPVLRYRIEPGRQ